VSLTTAMAMIVVLTMPEVWSLTAEV